MEKKNEKKKGEEKVGNIPKGEQPSKRGKNTPKRVKGKRNEREWDVEFRNEGLIRERFRRTIFLIERRREKRKKNPDQLKWGVPTTGFLRDYNIPTCRNRFPTI